MTVGDEHSLTMPARSGWLSTIAQLAVIPEEHIWLAKQKSARTRRAYRLDVQHFMRTLAITTPAELRQADHKAVIAWERCMRETEHAAASTYGPRRDRPRGAQICRRARSRSRLLGALDAR